MRSLCSDQGYVWHYIISAYTELIVSASRMSICDDDEIPLSKTSLDVVKKTGPWIHCLLCYCHLLCIISDALQKFPESIATCSTIIFWQVCHYFLHHVGRLCISYHLFICLKKYRQILIIFSGKTGHRPRSIWLNLGDHPHNCFIGIINHYTRGNCSDYTAPIWRGWSFTIGRLEDCNRYSDYLVTVIYIKCS